MMPNPFSIEWRKSTPASFWLASLALGLVTLLTGCSGITPNREARIESPMITVHDPPLRIYSARIEPCKDGFYLAGSVTRDPGHALPSHGHIHVRLIGEDGAVENESTLNLPSSQLSTPRRGQTRRAQFAVRFTQEPGALQSIELKVHARSDCSSRIH